jgi:hypothetical protein
MKNRSIILTCILSLFSFSIASSQSGSGSVSLETAVAVGKNFCLNTDKKYSGKNVNDLTFTLADTKKSDGIILYYIFNIDYNGTSSSNDGFIIISANYNSTPILAYVPEGSYSVETAAMNDSFTGWLNTTADEIEKSVMSKTYSARAEEQWGNLQAKGAWDVQVMTLHFTSKWNQTAYYNLYYPQTDINGHPASGEVYGNRPPTGCVALAMGQMMYYYNWPLQGTGSHSYIDAANPNSNSNCGVDDPSYGTLSFYDHTGNYDYSSMEDQPSGDNSAISKLVYNCAVSVDMDMAWCVSWTNTYYVPDAIKNFFGYSADAAYVLKSDYSTSDWENLIKEQLRMERPVQYRGQDPSQSMGHSYVCYGYETVNGENLFLFNFGWGGGFDGYYNLTPAEYPLSSYGYYAGAVIGIHPTSQPNLKITSASAPATVNVGATFNVNFNIKNAGTRSTLVGSEAAIYFSTDTTLDKSDTFLGTVSTPVLSSGSSTDLTGSVTIVNEDPGSYYLIINADSAHYVHESSEFDNNFHIAITTQSTGVYEYRSKASGNWSDASTWEYKYNSSWVNAPSAPNAASGAITVISGHTVTVTSNLTVNQTTVESGAKVTVDNCTMTISNSTGDDFVVNGTLELTGDYGEIDPDGTLIFNSGSTYIHNRNKGSVPAATWAVTSNCNITGMMYDFTTAAEASSFNQTFGNFTWNCTSQQGEISLYGNLQTIKGNFSVISTGGGTSYFALGGSTSGDLTVDGNFTLSGGNFTLCRYNASRTMTVKGDITISGGTFAFNNYDFSSSETLVADGNFYHTGGTITNKSTTSAGAIIFNGNSTHTYTSGGAVTLLVNFTVNSGSTLQMGTGDNPAIITGANSVFNLSSGATLGITSPDGISTSGSTGNIQVSVSRIFSTGANYIYNGKVNQNTGTGLPSNLTGSLIINSSGPSGSNTVTLNNARTIANGGNIYITNGTFAAGTSLTMSGTSTINRSGGTMTGTPQGSGVYNVVYSGNSLSTTTELNGSGLNNITINMNSGQTLTLEQSVAPDGNLTVNSGTFDLGFLTCYRSSSGGTLTIDNGATLRIGGTNIMPQNFSTHTFGTTSTVEYYGGTQVISSETSDGYGNLTISGSGTKSIAANGAVTVKSNLVTNDHLTVLTDSLNTNGSLIVLGNSTGTVTYKRKLHKGENGNYHYFSSPVVSNTAANTGIVENVWLWNEVLGDWGLTGSGIIGLQSGRGYNLSQVWENSDYISFTGSMATDVTFNATSPYSDVIDINSDYSKRTFASGRNSTSNYGGGGWNLIGNPYTSALDASAFIDANSSSFDPNYKAVYLYDGSVAPHGKYYYIGSSDGWGQAEKVTSYIQAGQGFFILAMNNSSQFSFTRSMQVHSTSSLMYKSTKAANPWPGLELIVKKGENEDATRVVYNDDMTFGLDPGYDVGQLTSDSPIEIYTTLVTGSEFNFARQALPPADFESTSIPIGISCAEGGSVTFSANVVPLQHFRFYLEDRNTGIITNLNTCTYTTEIPSNTYGTGRFYLKTTYTDRRENKSDENNSDLLNLKVWSSEHKIIIDGEVSSQATATIYDLQGHTIMVKKLTDTSYNIIDVPATVKGLCIVNVKDGTRKLSIRVVVL